MARTQIPGRQVLDQSINKDDIDITTAGKALITRLIEGSGIVIDSSTGVDSGTGDVTISSTGGALFGDDLFHKLEDGETYTTSSSWVTKLNLDVNGLVVGADYMVFATFQIKISNQNFPINVRALADDTTVLFESDYILARANYWVVQTGFMLFEDIIGSDHNLKIQFHSTSGKSVGIRRTRLVGWRIS